MMTNELYHHGIKGQKWGVRRYQNLDRSLTPAGKERYGRGTGEKIKSAVTTVGRTVGNAGKAVGRGIGNASKTVGSKISESYKKRHPEKMTDAELKAYASRLQMEKQVKQLKEELTPKKQHKIRTRIAGIMDKGIDKITNRAWDELANKIFEDRTVSDPYEVLKNPKATDKEINAARQRVVNEDIIRKSELENRVFNPDHFDTKKSSKKENDAFKAWRDSEENARDSRGDYQRKYDSGSKAVRQIIKNSGNRKAGWGPQMNEAKKVAERVMTKEDMIERMMKGKKYK